MIQFNPEEVVKRENISGGTSLFYGAVVSYQEWKQTEEFTFARRNLALRGFDLHPLRDKPKGIIVLLDSQGESDPVYANPFRLINHKIQQNDEIFIVQPMGSEKYITVTNTNSTNIIVPRGIEDHIVAANYGQTDQTLPCLL